MADNTGDNFSDGQTGSSQSSMEDTCSLSSIQEISGDELNRSDQHLGGEDVEMALNDDEDLRS